MSTNLAKSYQLGKGALHAHVIVFAHLNQAKITSVLNFTRRSKESAEPLRVLIWECVFLAVL